MTIFRGSAAALQTADPSAFVGPARTAKLAGGGAGVPVTIYRVRFDAGGRTNWHIHSGPQWLLVLEGTIRLQAWGQELHEAGAGDAVLIPPGEKHWHGAGGASGGAHLAVNIDATTEWLEPVTDEQYQSRS